MIVYLIYLFIILEHFIVRIVTIQGAKCGCIMPGFCLKNSHFFSINTSANSVLFNHISRSLQSHLRVEHHECIRKKCFDLSLFVIFIIVKYWKRGHILCWQIGTTVCICIPYRALWVLNDYSTPCDNRISYLTFVIDLERMLSLNSR